MKTTESIQNHKIYGTGCKELWDTRTHTNKRDPLAFSFAGLRTPFAPVFRQHKNARGGLLGTDVSRLPVFWFDFCPKKTQHRRSCGRVTLCARLSFSLMNPRTKVCHSHWFGVVLLTHYPASLLLCCTIHMVFPIRLKGLSPNGYRARIDSSWGFGFLS